MNAASKIKDATGQGRAMDREIKDGK